MRFKKIVESIIKEGRSNSIGLNEAVSIFRSSTYTYRADTTQIFRGIRGFDDLFGFVDPKSGKQRVSANTYNYYTLIIDNSEEWEPFPDRSQSIICVTDQGYAASYGQDYLVIPFNGASIGVAPSNDIWTSFSSTLDMNLRNFADALDQLATDVLNKSLPQAPAYFDKFKKMVNKIGEKTKDGYENIGDDTEGSKLVVGKGRDTKKLLDKWKSSDKDTFYKFLEDLLSPHKSGFKLYSYSPEFNVSLGREVWTDDKALLIHTDHVTEFFEEVNSQTHMEPIDIELLENRYNIE